MFESVTDRAFSMISRSRVIMSMSWSYFIQIVVCINLGIVVGWYLISCLRRALTEGCDKKKIFLYSTLLFLSPIAAYFMLLLLSNTLILPKHLCDFLTFGIVVSILYNYTYFPKHKKIIKLVVEEMTGKRVEIVLDSIDVPISDIQDKIATNMSIYPSSRIFIESGKGTIIEDLSSPFMTIVNDSAISIDPFDGSTSITIYISISDEVANEAADDIALGSPRNVPFYHGLLSNRGEVKYAVDTYFLTAKIPFASSDAKAFHLSAVEKFAAASPSSLNYHSAIKILPWKDDDVTLRSSISDTGEYPVPGQVPHEQKSPPKPFWKKKLRMPKMKLSEPCQQVRNGDVVLLQCDGKYLSLTRGWWLAWNSPAPRRSGAFTIEIIERAPQNKILETLNKMRRPSMMIGPSSITQGNLAQLSAVNGAVPMTTNPMIASNLHHNPKDTTTVQSGIGGNTNNDDLLFTGDTFRLRSMKFPEYELGITSSRINEDNCYVGLRKIGDNSSNDDWCIEVHFTFKAHSLGSQIIKNTRIDLM